MSELSNVVADAKIYGLELDAREKERQINVGRLQMIFKNVAALKPNIVSILLDDITLLWSNFSEAKQIVVTIVSPYEYEDIDQLEDLLYAFCVDEYPEIKNKFKFLFELNDGTTPIFSKGLALYVKKASNPDIPKCCSDEELEFFDIISEKYPDNNLKVSQDAFDRKKKVFFMTFNRMADESSIPELSKEIKEIGKSLGLRVSNLLEDKKWSSLNFILSSKPLDKMYNIPNMEY